MKRLLEDNRGNILFTAMVVMVGLMLGFAVYGTFNGAEAIIGERGNLITETNNPHNLSAGSTGVEATDEVRICIFCHASHNTKTELTDTKLIGPPLWNHSLSSATYTVLASSSVINGVDKYSEPGFGNVILLSSPPALPDGSSRLCLGCHDGTIGIGEVGSETVPIAMDPSDPCVTTGGKIEPGCTSIATGGKPHIGTDLTTKHAVSIPMNTGLITDSGNNCNTDGQTTRVQYPWIDPTYADVVLLRPTATQYGGNPGIAGVDARAESTKYGVGYNYGVQCSTCHDPHDWAASGKGFRFLVTSDITTLCSACHTGC